MDQAELEQLVDEVTRRVSARLKINSGVPGQSSRDALRLTRSGGLWQARSSAPGQEICGDFGPTTNGAREQRAAKSVLPALKLLPFGVTVSAEQLAAYIDHTLLRVDATKDDLRKLCDEAIKYGFAAVCVNTVNVSFCAAALVGTEVMVVAVAGFPLGAQTVMAKAGEAREAVMNGAHEIDMVINVGALRSRDYAAVLADIAGVVEAVAPHPVKVILETGALTREQKAIGCALAKIASAAFVKTSTGFGPGGATAEDVALMREIVGPNLGIKASGGIRTAEDAGKMIAAGANRIGASASVAIVTATREIH